MSTSFWDHPIATIEKALHIRKQIEALQSSLSNILGSAKAAIATKSADGRKGKRSAATIAKMKAAQKARWAKKGVASAEVKSTKPAGKLRKKRKPMSPEARARIAAAQRA